MTLVVRFQMTTRWPPLFFYYVPPFPEDDNYLSKCFDALLPFVPLLVASPHLQCQVFSLGTAIVAIMTHSLFGSSSSNIEDFQSALTVYMESPLSKLITTLEESFRTCHSVTDVDVSKLYDIVMADFLITTCLCHYGKQEL